MPALALMMLSLVLLHQAVRSTLNTPLIILSALAASLGILIKLPVIVFGLPAAVIVIGRRGWRSSARDVRWWMYLLIAVLPAWRWYRYARTLQERYGLQTFYLGESWRSILAEWSHASLFESVFLQKLFDAYAFPLFSAIAVIVLFARWRSCAGWLQALAVATLTYIFLAAGHIGHHFYYGLLAAPVLALAAAIGLNTMTERLSAAPGRVALAVLLIGGGLYGWHRVAHWWPHSRDALPYREAEAALDQKVPADGRILLFSGNNPTLFWMLHRKGWLAPPSDPAQWFVHAKLDAPAVAIDRQMIRSPITREELLTSFRVEGYRPLWKNAVLDVWIRPVRVTE